MCFGYPGTWHTKFFKYGCFFPHLDKEEFSELRKEFLEIYKKFLEARIKHIDKKLAIMEKTEEKKEE